MLTVNKFSVHLVKSWLKEFKQNLNTIFFLLSLISNFTTTDFNRTQPAPSFLGWLILRKYRPTATQNLYNFETINQYRVDFFFTARTSRQETIQLTIPGNVEQKSSTTFVQARKKKSMGIRALSAKQRKDDHIRALLKEHLSEIHALLQLEKPVPLEVGIVCG